ncbi:helix-turn-helix domain-containing protein [Nocardia cyriacigeorgica]|uniref:helix-turn-helix domain-containing protein n=1 Tax=Nocardia cyriacigeorgica TaxID=135487 RepID=UPI0018937E9F|nr:helix-turn-helix transcriptional regulator [Nocardia cyriacigeorgica]MBF6435734.1 helix-turn-helix domain-containing protein [Nocardia cyriacigeorgica]MBF6454185.1 helix-turn-helix domain-containing protein [Nocardia cyriacigeorgica]MBF6480639.1 helix-turn-helix domain-containing protein [Nocardia cyriacigeorgica]MBF6552079.1 helix-turn-helix domain-containing protein [Nocardia cyriacigeorgica]
MPVESSPSTLPRRVLGRRLVQLRESRELSRALAARRVQMGTQTLWRLETGRSSEVKRMVINALCDLYESSAEERRELLWLAEETKKEGWWQSYVDAMVPEVEVYVSLEQSARRTITWQSTLVPGLLQTADYRHAVWDIAKTQRQRIDFTREIALLERRQSRLRDSDNFAFSALLCESVLLRQVGGPEVMAAQLERLLEAGELPNVSIRVARLGTPSHAGLINKDFVFIEFPEHLNPALSEPPVVFIEGFTGDLYLDKPLEIETYRAAYTDIGRVALDERDTRSLIESILKERAA